MPKPAMLFLLGVLPILGCRGGPEVDPALEELEARDRLQRVAWLTGTWQMERPDGFTREEWGAPAGGVMLGTGCTVRDDEMVAFEFLRLETRGKSLIYVAHPGGRSPGVEFELRMISGRAVRFENPEHDFPTWIEYERTGPDSCMATIGGDAGTVEFHYER